MLLWLHCGKVNDRAFGCDDDILSEGGKRFSAHRRGEKGRERERGSSGMIDDCIHLWNRSATSTETCKSKRRMSASGTIISGIFLNAMNWSHLQCGHIFPLQAYQHLSESIASCLFHWTWLGTLQFQLTPSLELAIKHAQWSRCLMTNQDQAMFFWRTTHI